MPNIPTMEWDYQNQLHKTISGTVTAFYNYDANGERARKITEKTGEIREERIYFGNFEVYRKYINNTLTTERKTVHIADENKRIATIDSLTVDAGVTLGTPTDTIRYQYDNHLGSSCLELDENAATISYEEYHPFGTSSYRLHRNSTEASLKRYRYVGKERDEETGLYYYGARYYAGWVGRFVSVDPLQHKYPHYTPYQYAGNKPISYIDLDGLEEVDPMLEKRVSEISTQKISDQYYMNSYIDMAQMLELESIWVKGKKDRSFKISDNIVNDLRNITGLDIAIKDNKLTFRTENEFPVFIKDASSSPIGSETAREELMHAIMGTRLSNKEKKAGAHFVQANFKKNYGKGSETAEIYDPLSKRAGIRVNKFQVEDHIKGSENVNPKTMGYGMMFFHELMHTPAGGNLPDYTGYEPMTGGVVEKMNEIRKEMGSDWGIRFNYKIEKSSTETDEIIPFSQEAFDKLSDKKYRELRNSSLPYINIERRKK